jgi:hypothetical protein
MPLSVALEAVTGARELFDWFGYWPDFHDAEIIRLRLEAGAPSSILIHTWEMTNEIDAKGFYELRKHVVVEFVIEAISTINLQDPWDHSILFDLSIDKSDSGFRLSFSSSYGLSGTIEAQGLSLRITPGKPSQEA